MNYRVVSIDEHQLLVSIKHEKWGTKKNILINWNKDDKLLFFVNGYLASEGQVQDDKRFEIDKSVVKEELIWSDDFKYQLKMKFNYYIPPNLRDVTSKELFNVELTDGTLINNHALALRNQLKIEDPNIIQKIEELDGRINDFKRSIYSMENIKRKMNIRLAETHEERLHRNLTELYKMCKRNSYGNYDDTLNILNTIWFSTLLQLNQSNHFQNNEPDFNMNIELDILGNSNDHIFNSLGIIEDFSEEILQLGIDEIKINKINYKILKIFNEIDYSLSKKINLHHTFKSYLSWCYDFLLNDSKPNLSDYVKLKIDNTNQMDSKFLSLLVNIFDGIIENNPIKIVEVPVVNKGLIISRLSKRISKKNYSERIQKMLIRDESKIFNKISVTRSVMNDFAISKIMTRSNIKYSEMELMIISDLQNTSETYRNENFFEDINKLSKESIIVLILQNPGINFSEEYYNKIKDKLINQSEFVISADIQTNITSESKSTLFISRKGNQKVPGFIEVSNLDELKIELVKNNLIKNIFRIDILEDEMIGSQNFEIQTKTSMIKSSDVDLSDLQKSEEIDNNNTNTSRKHNLYDVLSEKQKIIFNTLISLNIKEKGNISLYDLFQKNLRNKEKISHHEFEQVLRLMENTGILNQKNLNNISNQEPLDWYINNLKVWSINDKI